MNKRGVELTLNVVIVSILVVLVLVSLVVFFTFGFENTSMKIKDMFTKAVVGQDLNLVISLCQQHCELAASLDEESRWNTAFCKSTYDVDADGDNKADYTNVYCYDEEIGVNCLEKRKEFCRFRLLDRIFVKVKENFEVNG